MQLSPSQCAELCQHFAGNLQSWQNRTLASGDPAACQQTLNDLLDDLLSKLAISGLPLPEQRALSSQLWEQSKQTLVLGELQAHARNKPRGYAGDFELLSKICNHYRSTSPIGQFFDAYFQAQAAPAAVRGRIELVTRWAISHLKDFACNSSLPAPHLVSIGCGAGEDLLNACQAVSPSILPQTSLTLLDLDPAAVEFASQAFASQFAQRNLPALSRFHCQQANLVRLAKRKDLKQLLTSATQIYCTGIFDYLADDVAQDLLACFWEQLAPGGSLYVFNFAPHNPTRAYMEWIGDWYLIYRTESDLQKLALNAGIPVSAITHGSEPQGIDLFISATKPR